MSGKFLENDLRVSEYILDALNRATVHHEGAWTKSVEQDTHKFVCFYFKPQCSDTQEVINKANGSSSGTDEGWLAFKLEHHFKSDIYPDLETGSFTLKSLNQFGRFNKKTFTFNKNGTLNPSPIAIMLNTIIDGFSQEYARLISRSVRVQFFESLSHIFNFSKLNLSLVSHNRLRARDKSGKEITVNSIDYTKPPKAGCYEVTLSNLNGEEVEDLLIFAATQNKELDENSSDLERLEHADKCLALALTRESWSTLDFKMRDALIQASGDYSEVPVNEFLERDDAHLSITDYVNVAVSVLSSKYPVERHIVNFQQNLRSRIKSIPK
tara:strand:+ start:15594 stop:16568 length:975 start_codon:yes stop_codon:yes gene_type:complete